MERGAGAIRLLTRVGVVMGDWGQGGTHMTYRRERDNWRKAGLNLDAFLTAFLADIAEATASNEDEQEETPDTLVSDKD